MSDIETAFPDVDPGIKPVGSRVLVQIRTPRTKTPGGILMIENDRETELWNTQVGKVIATGALAFKNRNTMEPWPEGSWCSPGEFVRVPKYGGDRWECKVGDDRALFVIFNDLEIIGTVTADPTTIKAFF